MKKYVYILLLLASVSTLATAQIKIGNYTFKDGGEYTGELKGRSANSRAEKMAEGARAPGVGSNDCSQGRGKTHLPPCRLEGDLYAAESGPAE